MSRALRRSPTLPDDDDPVLLIPGPLRTSHRTKQAMTRDWAPRDCTFLRINASLLENLAQIAHGDSTFVTVPVPGSGSYAVEAMLTTFVGPKDKVLIAINGPYADRARNICEIAKRDIEVYETSENSPLDANQVERVFQTTPSLTHLFCVHCETNAGLLNPLEEIASIAVKYRKRLLVDAISTFGALDLNLQTLGCDAIAASSNKCLEGMPGLGFVICRTTAIENCEGNATTLVLDLYEQWKRLALTGQYRFTPPAQIISALKLAVDELISEGGVSARRKRYERIAQTLRDGMQALGFKSFLPDQLQAPIAVTFLTPDNPRFSFDVFYDKLKTHGFIIYPGKLKSTDSFQVGCIGDIGTMDIKNLLASIRAVLVEMHVDLK